MQRDLSLTPGQVRDRLAAEYAAGVVERKLRQDLGGDFGGAWLSGDGLRLTVGVTSPAASGLVRAAGAQPKLVDHSERKLDAAKSLLDRAARPGSGVTSWYVDVTTNTVVVLADPSALDAAARFVRASGASPGAVRVVARAERPVPLYDVRGGDAYHPGNSRCSIGFSVGGGFVTAGHCGAAGTGTSGSNGVGQGVVQGSVFPGNDYAWVAVNSSWVPTAQVNLYNGGIVPVDGSQEAPTGGSVCRSGSTTGWHCGTIGAKNVTVQYPQGAVQGLTQTNVCAEPGDSGGSFISGGQAQGVTSGGSGNCSVGGTTYFQPVNPILQAYGLRLVTSGAPAPPTATMQCDSGASTILCNVYYTSSTPVQIRWTLRGSPISGWDNLTVIRLGCSSATALGVTVSNAGGSVSDSRLVNCNHGEWP